MKIIFLSTLKDTKGVALVLTFAIMAALMMIVLTYLFMTSTEMKTIDDQVSNTQAFYTADAGLQYAVYRLKYDDTWDEDGGVTHQIVRGGPTPYVIGSFFVDVRDIAGGTPPTVYKRVTSTGTVVSGLIRMVKQDVEVTP